ncbi:type IV pilus assembly protein PilV [Polaromonas sp. YR568]|uniref:type IV pilus modification protein PilV n=1 Tax=Polaromonas sp. YR568 TaxID=1855301 RepID=UPI0008E30A32|nr:type IV pilus modification protein PilV [Polaromonas sp. YR568]SFU66940.1 type IV pilus assembly protein PilV [Polaromonas sp. YR568]
MKSNFQKGSSLLEVLIAMLVMSFALLALSGATAAALLNSKLSQFQTIGSQLAQEYGERARGNVAGFRAGNYNQVTAYSGASGAVAVPPCAMPTNCTAAELAAIDVAEWTNALRRRLPGDGAYVTGDATNKLATDIWVIWNEPDLSFNASSLSVSASGGDRCPAPALAGLPAAAARPRCMYFRVSL